MKYIRKHNEGIIDNFKNFINPKPKIIDEEENWENIERELYWMLYKIDEYNINVDLWNKPEDFPDEKRFMSFDTKKKQKQFIREYGNRPSIVKSGKYYKLDLAKFYKDPDPYIFTQTQKERAIEYFKNEFKDRVGIRDRNNGIGSTGIESPYLKDPIINMNKIFKQINEDSNIDDSTENSIMDFLSSALEMDICMNDLNSLWSDASNDIHLDNFLYGMKWMNFRFNEISIWYMTWMEEIEEKFSLSRTFIEEESHPSDFIYKRNHDDDRQEHMKKVAFLLLKLVKISKDVTEKSKKFDESILPDKYYPFEVDLCDLHQSIKEWVNSVIGNVSAIAMREETDKVFKQINELSNNKKYENYVIDFIKSLYTLQRYIGHLLVFWDNDYIFDINLGGVLSNVNWIDNNKFILDNIPGRISKWIKEIESKLNISEVDEYYTHPFNDLKVCKDGMSKGDYGKEVFSILKDIEKASINCVNRYNYLTRKEVPLDNYPFNVPMENLDKSIIEWVKSSTGKISEIDMREETDKAFKQINENIYHDIKNHLVRRNK